MALLHAVIDDSTGGLKFPQLYDFIEPELMVARSPWYSDIFPCFWPPSSYRPLLSYASSLWPLSSCDHLIFLLCSDPIYPSIYGWTCVLAYYGDDNFEDDDDNDDTIELMPWTSVSDFRHRFNSCRITVRGENLCLVAFSRLISPNNKWSIEIL